MRIAIVGAGKGGSNLLKVLSATSGIEMSVIVDQNSGAEGLRLAREKGIPTEGNVEAIERYGVDVVIEATGSSAVMSKLQSHYGSRCQIIDSAAAEVLNRIVEGQVDLVEKMGRQMTLIQRLTHTFQGEFDQLINSLDKISQLSVQFNDAVENSNQYIAKTDEITNSVNKIAMQTKILGLNANIEAARAGEHGKGFAVVANEVQKLSDSSTQFATEISDLLKELSAEIQIVNRASAELNSVTLSQRTAAEVMNDAIEELAHVL